ncbi:hypothetical protein EPUS_01012 [Endocarpon pusillum Z07020]|uniref:Major facilitator superfamily (MFS) profile domain-containing protein n=1 Tax=Endocarpon pusillum (strain Z07020 / HMAS-L-300199) TaxID=1263415 RepID=U1GNA3_ENDPU|nr:uncharacterized protein EPUS_01012 [Endocarpon pusillum Z07020]ERF73758.1 hypothetical protein EPUS_01012 [Endocarpon pusillum Z07020]
MIVQIPVSVYAAEVAPSHIRGSLVMNWQLFDALGIFCGFTANLAVSQLGPLAWRFQTASAFLPTIMMLTLIFVCPESPRFYMKRGAKYYGEAYKSLLHLRGLPLLAAKELFYCHLQIELEKKLLSPKSHDAEQRLKAHEEPREFHANDQPGLRSRKARSVDHCSTHAEVYRSPSVANEESTEASKDGASEDQGNRSKILTLEFRNRRHSVRSKNNCMHLWHRFIAPQSHSINYWQKLGQLFTKGRIRRVTSRAALALALLIVDQATIAAGVCMISQQLCGVNALAFYSSTLFRDAQAPGIDALWLSWGIGLVNFVSGLPAYWLIDRYGRRFLLLITIPGLALSMLAAAFSFNIPEEQQKAHTGVISLFWFIFMAIYSLGMGPVPFSLSAEVFPLENRVVGMSFAVFLNFLGAGILTLVVPPLTDVKHTKILSVFAGAHPSCLTPFIIINRVSNTDLRCDTALNVVAFILVFFFGMLLMLLHFLAMPLTEPTVRETAGATLSRTPGNLNPMSLEELNYIFGVRNFEHIEYQVKTVVPWAFNRYIRRMDPPECPEHPKQLYKWAWEVEKSRKEKQQQQEAQALQMEEEQEANAGGVGEIERIP